MSNVIYLWQWIAKNPVRAYHAITKKTLIQKRKEHNDEVLKKYKLGKYKPTNSDTNK